MLHAFARNKSKAYTRFLRVRDESEPRVSSEDEITSLVFGPLDFLSAADNWALWKYLLQSHASRDMSGPLPSDFFADFLPATCNAAFWPRKDNIEPDLVIEFSDARGLARTLLVELKWDAPESGEDQLEKQWLRYQRGRHATSLHVFIAKRIEQRPPAALRPWSCQADGMDANRLRMLRWHELKHEIVQVAALPGTSVPLRRWCLLASAFLKQLGIRPFIGFHALAQRAGAIPDEDDAAHRFWQQTLPSATTTKEAP